jgi:hypothetical protein
VLSHSSDQNCFSKCSASRLVSDDGRWTNSPLWSLPFLGGTVESYGVRGAVVPYFWRPRGINRKLPGSNAWGVLLRIRVLGRIATVTRPAIANFRIVLLTVITRHIRRAARYSGSVASNGSIYREMQAPCDSRRARAGACE